MKNCDPRDAELFVLTRRDVDLEVRIFDAKKLLKGGAVAERLAIRERMKVLIEETAKGARMK